MGGRRGCGLCEVDSGVGVGVVVLGEASVCVCVCVEGKFCLVSSVVKRKCIINSLRSSGVTVGVLLCLDEDWIRYCTEKIRECIQNLENRAMKITIDKECEGIYCVEVNKGDVHFFCPSQEMPY